MKSLYKSLASFQQEVPVILKDTQGYGYNYADWTAILEVINPLLKKHGLGFYQALEGEALKTVIFHAESAESIEGAADIPQGVQLKGMNDFQVLGSGITYMKRYALSAMLGLITDSDTDASGEQTGRKFAPKASSDRKPSGKQIQLIEDLATKKGIDPEAFKVRLKQITTAKQASEAIEKLMGNNHDR